MAEMAIKHAPIHLDILISATCNFFSCTFFTVHVSALVERGSSVGRMPDSQSREPGFESPLLPFRSLGIFFHFSRLSCINEYLAIDSGGNVSE